jgi:HK97 family phage prohead protease
MSVRDLRNLPAPVLDRLSAVVADDAPGEGVRADVDALRRGQLLNARSFSVETRANDDGSVTVDGYATVYDYPYDVAGGPPYGWTETIRQGAAAKSVAEQDPVGLLINHDSDTAFGLPVAATWAETLTLDSDRHGLRIDGRLAPGDVVTDFLIRRLDRGEAHAMSFAFRVLRQEWDEDYTERTITELGLVDVSVVTYPANPATVALLRAERIAGPSRRRASVARYMAEAERLRLAIP